ncbi:hypothetical protein D5086_017677 [Populus alba]|uniref:Uncharacterized protein n=1 Tax=Populus alba TaxID=43335 RepID=A0ACC4BN90_POPAL
MMGGGGSRIVICVLLTVLILAFLSSGFTPVDNYLIDCGSPTNTTVGGRVFVADDSASIFLSTPKSTSARSSKSVTSGDDSPLYQTARIFDGTSKYSFSIRQPGRHWIRLYFNPFVSGSYDMSGASFDVSTPNHVFLSNFSVKTSVVKEFSANVTSKDLVITLTPSGNSFAFLNALEVVSVPDELITDDADTFNPAGRFKGLPGQALETVHRVNMGGPTVSFENDTLGRTWVPDKSYLIGNNLAINVFNIAAVKYVGGGATQDSAPNAVYGTAIRMNSENDPNSNFNVTWEFNVNPGFQYLVRFHFCDIVSSSLNNLYFNVYIDSWLVAENVDPSSFANALAVAFYKDFVTAATVSNKLRVSIGPTSTMAGVYPNAILNGLEIMKMNNSLGSLSGPAPDISDSSSKKNVGVIVGLSIGAVILVLLAGFFFVFCRKRRLARQGNSKMWIPLSINGANSHTMGSKYSNGTTATLDSNLGPSMGDVLWNLEYALQLQEAVVPGDPEDNSINMIGELSPQINNFSHTDSSVSAAKFEASSVDDLSGVSMSRKRWGNSLYFAGKRNPILVKNSAIKLHFQLQKRWFSRSLKMKPYVNNLSKEGESKDDQLSLDAKSLNMKDEISKDRRSNGKQAQTFTFEELAAATSNFRSDCFLGEGGFGKVCRGYLDKINQVVAIKQLDRNGVQGIREFVVEVVTLSLADHPNLVKLIGFCAEGDQRLLVYEYMPLGSLENHLHDIPPNRQPLDWNTRMKIAAGAAKGLEYLHNEMKPPVIYRDLKCSNIFLGEGYHPKLSDFGLAKVGPSGDKTHVSTRVMGTYGYCAPDYAVTGQLTFKSDIYSFGVVLLEIITGRKAIDQRKERGEQNLVAWARPMFKDRRNFSCMVDPLLQGQYPIRGLYQALAIAAMCVQEQPNMRPAVSDLVMALNYLASHKYDPQIQSVQDSRRSPSRPGLDKDRGQ